jgi:hypothetical protein
MPGIMASCVKDAVQKCSLNLLALQVQEFHQVLRREFRIPCTIRQEKGRDIAGACGQLVIDYKQGVMQKSVLDIEEIAAHLISKTASS